MLHLSVLVLQKHEVLDVSYVQSLTLVPSQLDYTIPRWPTTHALLCSLQHVQPVCEVTCWEGRAEEAKWPEDKTTLPLIQCSGKGQDLFTRLRLMQTEPEGCEKKNL